MPLFELTLEPSAQESQLSFAGVELRIPGASFRAVVFDDPVGQTIDRRRMIRYPSMALGSEQIGAVPRPFPIFLEPGPFWHPPQPKNSGLRAGNYRIGERACRWPARLLYGDRALQLAGQAPFPRGTGEAFACALAHRA